MTTEATDGLQPYIDTLDRAGIALQEQIDRSIEANRPDYRVIDLYNRVARGKRELLQAQRELGEGQVDTDKLEARFAKLGLSAITSKAG